MNRWKIGRVTVTRVVEIEGPTRGTFLFAPATPENILRHAWLQPHFASPEGYFISAVQAWVIESEDRRIIVDTCVGNDKPRSLKFWNMLQTNFLTDLAEAGFPRQSIDTVLCTHLHVDHVGWNTMLSGDRWVPTFPHARYLFARREWDYWSQQPSHPEGDVMGDSVRPVIEAGLCELVEMDHRLTDEVWLEPTPGHTPGHVSVRISSEGREAVITGDLMHHPVQCAEPDWASNYDADPAAARQTRREFLARYADGPVLVLGTHFATPSAGHIVSEGAVWRLAV
ncbi:MAG TPA: MBL fold metallo-hydrolase [Blastocatellia bacterium]|nr:MBL fold metallo-hydrolase [Blastocatellia bacterium]